MLRLKLDYHEINYHFLKVLVGFIAIGLAALTEFLSVTDIESISASYHQGGSARDVFVGLLFTISAFLLAYNGQILVELVLAKIAAIAALLIAIFPCDMPPGLVSEFKIHYISAGIMFAVLACYCWIFYARARQKKTGQSIVRRIIYATCGITIVLAIAVLGYDAATKGSLTAWEPRLVFYGERAGLIAFGFSWIVASRVFPWITAREERVSILPIARP